MRRFLLLAACVACGPSSLLVGSDEEDRKWPEMRPSMTQSTDSDSGSSVVPVDTPRFDASVLDCPLGEAVPIFLLTDSNNLSSFDPVTGEFSTLLQLSCPTTPGAHPRSIAVDRERKAWVLYATEGTSANTASMFDGVYRVDLVSGYCVRTSRVTDVSPFGPDGLFGMTFGVLPNGEEALFGSDGTLVRFDNKTSSVVGEIEAAHQRVELTGSSDGRLFAFLPQSPTFGPSALVEINKMSGGVTRLHQLSTTATMTSIAFWGGDIFMFSSEQAGGTSVHRYRLGERKSSLVTARPTLRVIGAGVSTCAPKR